MFLNDPLILTNYLSSVYSDSLLRDIKGTIKLDDLMDQDIAKIAIT